MPFYFTAGVVKSSSADPGAHLASGGPFSSDTGLRHSGRSTETSRMGVGETSLSVIVLALLYFFFPTLKHVSSSCVSHLSLYTFLHTEMLCFSPIFCRKVHSHGNHYSSMMPHQPLLTNPMAMSAHQPISIGIAHVVWPQPAANKRNKPSSNRLILIPYLDMLSVYGVLGVLLKNKK